MSNLAILMQTRAGAAVAEDDYLGPAHVMERCEGGVRVELPAGKTAVAQLALAFPYEAAVGDVVLVIGKGGAFYMIGVLAGTGRAVLTMPGDVEVRAVGGTLTLAGDKGVRVTGPEVEVSAGKLKMAADAVVQTFTTAYQRVRELWSVRAGQHHTVVDEGSYAKSKSAVIVTEEKMAINGKEIHLG